MRDYAYNIAVEVNDLKNKSRKTAVIVRMVTGLLIGATGLFFYL